MDGMKKEKIGYEHFFPEVPPDRERFFRMHLESCLRKKSLSFLRKGPIPNFEESIKMAELFGNEKPEYCEGMLVSPNPIKKNMDFDVISLLSTNCGNENDNGNYLVRSSNGEKVQVESLKGKYILVCCFFVPMYWEQIFVSRAHDISLASFEMVGRYDFEMVLVAKMRPEWANDKWAFDRFVSNFSCLAVPFHHSLRRDYICQTLEFDGLPAGLLVDPHHKVLQDDVDFVGILGAAEGFPFTDEKLDAIEINYKKVWRGQSLEGLLGCKPSDTLKKNPGGGLEEVLVSELKHKVVGLYLCYHGHDILVLDKVYRECRARGLPFEIVLVYAPFNSNKPLKLLQALINGALEKHKISWWVLPFNNSICRRLCRMCCFDVDDRLVIIGPRYEFVDLTGLPLIRSLGIDAYPFSKESVVQKEFERKKELKLDSLLLADGSQGYVCRRNNDSDRVPVAELLGKHIILYMCPFNCPDSELRLELVEWYEKIKSNHSDFDVVLFNINSKSSKYDEEFLSSMPWLVCPVSALHTASVVKQLYFRGIAQQMLVSFDKDGKICSTCVELLLRSQEAEAFPFTSNLHEGVFMELEAAGLSFLSEDVLIPTNV